MLDRELIHVARRGRLDDPRDFVAERDLAGAPRPRVDGPAEDEEPILRVVGKRVGGIGGRRPAREQPSLRRNEQGDQRAIDRADPAVRDGRRLTRRGLVHQSHRARRADAARRVDDDVVGDRRVRVIVDLVRQELVVDLGQVVARLVVQESAAPSELGDVALQIGIRGPDLEVLLLERRAQPVDQIQDARRVREQSPGGADQLLRHDVLDLLREPVLLVLDHLHQIAGVQRTGERIDVQRPVSEQLSDRYRVDGEGAVDLPSGGPLEQRRPRLGDHGEVRRQVDVRDAPRGPGRHMTQIPRQVRRKVHVRKPLGVVDVADAAPGEE